MANVFKQLSKLNNQLQTLSETADSIIVKEQIALLKEIASYVKNYKWKGDLNDKIAVYLKYNCSYAVLRDTYGLSKNAADVCIYRASETIWDKIGKSTLKLIEQGETDAARDLFYYRSGKYKLKDYLLSEMGESLPKQGKYMTIKLSDCTTELRFIFEYSKAGYNKALGNIDPIKLAYVRYILEEDSPKLATQRTVLHKLLTEGKYNATIAEIKEKNL